MNDITVAIPAHKSCYQLDRSVTILQAQGIEPVVIIDPSINVSEARQQITEDTDTRYLCFLDYDSEMRYPGWLDQLMATAAGGYDVVFGNEIWGSEEQPMGGRGHGIIDTDQGPACCMLIDLKRLPKEVSWNTHIGLRNGWLGGDYEEVEYCNQLSWYDLRIGADLDCIFHHTGGRKGMLDFNATDRCRSVQTMRSLLMIQHTTYPHDKDFFKGIKYVKADPNDDNMLAPGSNLRDCYIDTVREYGLLGRREFKWLK